MVSIIIAAAAFIVSGINLVRHLALAEKVQGLENFLSSTDAVVNAHSRNIAALEKSVEQISKDDVRSHLNWEGLHNRISYLERDLAIRRDKAAKLQAAKLAKRNKNAQPVTEKE